MLLRFFILILIIFPFLPAEGLELREEETFYRGRVTEVGEKRIVEVYEGYREERITFTVEIFGKDDLIYTEHSISEGLEQGREFKEGDRVVVVGYQEDGEEESFHIYDYDRSRGLVLVALIFMAIIFYFGRVRGVGSLFGLGFSILILFYYIIPGIVKGGNPAIVTIVGSVLIASVSLFLSHGFNKRTPIIWLSTVTTLVLSVFLSSLFIEVTHLFGMGSESSLSFQIGEYSYINLKGLLLAGIVISVLGILDDVTATQTAVIWELKKSNPKLGFKELYKRSLSVGREHIASLVSTLALVYAGASLPLFILIKGVEYVPWWAKINSEPIAEEIIRTVIGSSALILAVPIASLFASYFINRMKIEKS